jgi:hypothetical protein
MIGGAPPSPPVGGHSEVTPGENGLSHSQYTPTPEVITAAARTAATTNLCRRTVHQWLSKPIPFSLEARSSQHAKRPEVTIAST